MPSTFTHQSWSSVGVHSAPSTTGKQGQAMCIPGLGRLCTLAPQQHSRPGRRQGKCGALPTVVWVLFPVAAWSRLWGSAGARFLLQVGRCCPSWPPHACSRGIPLTTASKAPSSFLDSSSGPHPTLASRPPGPATGVWRWEHSRTKNAS